MRREKKNKFLTLTLALLVVTIAILLLLNPSANKVDADLFKIESLSSVDKVVVKSNATTVELSFDGTRWKVNQQYDADDQMITVLFATLEQVRPKRQLSATQLDEISGDGTEVTLFVEEKEIKHFRVFGNEKKSEAYFAMNDAGAYVMTIPGYRVYVGGIFELDESGWRDKRIFNFNWRNFKSLSAQFPGNPGRNFEVADQGAGFQIVGLPKADTARLNDYLDRVSLLVAQRIANETEARAHEKLQSVDPEVIITVTDLGDRRIDLSLFETEDQPTEIIGRWNGSQWVFFRPKQAVELSKGRDFFVR